MSYSAYCVMDFMQLTICIYVTQKCSENLERKHLTYSERYT